MFTGNPAASTPGGAAAVFAGALVGGSLAYLLPDNHRLLRIATGIALGASLAGLVVSLTKQP